MRVRDGEKYKEKLKTTATRKKEGEKIDKLINQIYYFSCQFGKNESNTGCYVLPASKCQKVKNKPEVKEMKTRFFIAFLRSAS